MNDAWLEGLSTQCKARCSYEKTGQFWSVFLSPEDILQAAQALYDEDYFIEDVSVVDTADGFLVVYHFDRFGPAQRVTLRVLVPHDKPELPSIASVFSGADWHEREQHDFFGVVFTGHPNLIPLLLDPEEDIHPLVKEDKKRKPLKDLMAPGDIVECDPDFDLFAGKEAGAEEEQQGDEEEAGE